MLEKFTGLNDLELAEEEIQRILENSFLSRQVYTPPSVKIFEQNELTQGGDNGPLESTNGAFNS